MCTATEAQEHQASTQRTGHTRHRSRLLSVTLLGGNISSIKISRYTDPEVNAVKVAYMYLRTLSTESTTNARQKNS
jgi:hypothetical protein